MIIIIVIVNTLWTIIHLISSEKVNKHHRIIICIPFYLYRLDSQRISLVHCSCIII